MKVFNHPVHPLVIHFPTALLPMEFVLSLISFTKNDVSFQIAGFYCLSGGVLIGFAAIITGLIELVQMPKSDKKALATAIYHGFFNGTVIAIFAVIAYKGWNAYPDTVLPSVSALILKGALNCCLFFGNYLGGQLVYKYFVGLPLKTNAHENA